MESDLLKYYEEMQHEGVLLYFNGPVSQGIVEGIAELMRNKMQSEDAGMASVQRVFSILVEQMQNIVRYSSERQPAVGGHGGEMACGQVVVGKGPDGRFFVACGNKINFEDGNVLAERIETIRSMSLHDLKAYYRERRRSVFPSSAKGAGLGLVEMARKASQPLDYDIIPLDASTSFFSMKVVAQ